MDKNSIIEKLTSAIEQSKGDWGRNQYLLKRIKKNRDILNSDKLYLEKILGVESSDIVFEPEPPKQQIPKKDTSVFLNPNLIKCSKCNREIKLDEKSLRHQNSWYHENCIVHKIQNKITHTIEDKKPVKIKPDAVQVGLTVTIVVFLVTSVYFILGSLSTIAMGIGGAITFYHLIGATGKLCSRNKPGMRAPSMFMIMLLGSPFVIGGLIA